MCRPHLRLQWQKALPVVLQDDNDFLHWWLSFVANFSFQEKTATVAQND